MKRITVFETTDGQKFTSAKEAKAHESSITLDQLLTEWFANGDSFTVESLRNEMLASGWKLINLLSAIVRQVPLPEDEVETDTAEDTDDEELPVTHASKAA